MLGTFRIDVKVAKVDDLMFAHSVQCRPWVDTGATLTQIPSSILNRLGVIPIREEEFELADGRVFKCKIGSVCLLVEGKLTVDEVTFGKAGADPLLGATTLEHLGLAADPVSQRLFRPRRGIIQYSKLTQ